MRVNVNQANAARCSQLPNVAHLASQYRRLWL